MSHSYSPPQKISLLRVLAQVCALCLAGLTLASRAGLAQIPADASQANSAVTISRAEQEAERTVALSAEKIIELLRAQPGLLLEVKKLLIREAFAQGRLLASADLDDEALFRLLWEDENVRVLATHEIEQRNYVSVRPTRAEVAYARERTAQREMSRAALGRIPADRGAPQNQYSQAPFEGASQSSSPAPGVPADSNDLGAPISPDPSPENPPPGMDRTSLESDSPPDNFLSLRSESGRNQFDEMEIDANNLNPIAQQQSSAAMRVNSATHSTGDGRLGAAGQAWNPLREETGAGTKPWAAQPSSAGFNAASSDRGRELWQFPSDDVSRSATAASPDVSVPLNQDRPVIRHRPNPYANVPSLYDLYTQMVARPPVLTRFGTDVFRNRNGNLDSLPMDLPVGPDYVLGPGDGLNIQLSGSCIAQRICPIGRRIARSERYPTASVGFDPPAHLCSFEPRTISRLVETSGFQVLELRNAPVILNQDLWKNVAKTVLHAGSEFLYFATFGRTVLGYSTVIAARRLG